MSSGKEVTFLQESDVQRVGFYKAIENGLSVSEAAAEVGLPSADIANLLDSLGNTGLERIIDKRVHREILTTGKELAWKTAKQILRDPRTSPAVRWAAAKWTLEAGGEGIGVTRNSRIKQKDLHEMDEGELTRVVENARKIVEGTAIDITPVQVDDDEYGGLFS